MDATQSVTAAYVALKDRRDAVIARIAELDALIAESRSEWLSTGRDTPESIRAARAAERARLVVERIELIRQIEKAKAEAKGRRAPHAHSVLVRLCKEAGMANLVEEANRIAAAAVPIDAPTNAVIEETA